MPCFAMICSCSMLLSCSKHCFLMLNSWHVIFTKSVTWYLFHFCHACLNLLLCELAIAQCSYFVKHLEWIPAMCFVDMLVCSSLLFLPCLASMPCLLPGCMLSLSCNALWWVHRARKHAYLISVLPCSSFLPSLNLLTIIAMSTWLPLYFLIPFGLWSVRDFCCMLWVASCHGLLCHDMFL